MFPILIALYSIIAANITVLLITPVIVYLWKVCNGTLSAPAAPPPRPPVNKVARPPHTPVPSSKVAPPRAGHIPAVEYNLPNILPTGYHNDYPRLYKLSSPPTLATPLHHEDTLSMDALAGFLLASICIALGILSLSKKPTPSRPKTTQNFSALHSPEPFLCVTDLGADTPPYDSRSRSIGFTSFPGFEDAGYIPVARVDDIWHRMDVIEASLRRFALPLSPSPIKPAESTTPLGTPPRKHQPGPFVKAKPEGSQAASTAPLMSNSSPKIELSLHIDLSQFCSLKRNLRGRDGSSALTPRARTLKLTPSKVRVDIPDFTPDGYERQRMRDRRKSVLEPRRRDHTPDDDPGGRLSTLHIRGSTPESTLCAVTRSMTPRTAPRTMSTHTTTPHTAIAGTTPPVSPPPSSYYPTHRLTSEQTTARNDLPDFLAPLSFSRDKEIAPFYMPRPPSPSPFKLPPITFFSATGLGTGLGSDTGNGNARQKRSVSRVRPKIPDFHARYDEQEVERKAQFREPLLERHEDRVQQAKSSRKSLSDTPLFEKGRNRDESLRELPTFHLHGATRDHIGLEPYSRGGRRIVEGYTPTPSARITNRDSSLGKLVAMTSGRLTSGQSNTYSSTSRPRLDLKTRPATLTSQYPNLELHIMEPFKAVSIERDIEPPDAQDVISIKANAACLDEYHGASSQSSSLAPADAGTPRPGWIMHVEELTKSSPRSPEKLERKLRVVNNASPYVPHSPGSLEDSRWTPFALPSLTRSTVFQHPLDDNDDIKPLKPVASLEDQLLTAVRTPLRRKPVPKLMCM